MDTTTPSAIVGSPPKRSASVGAIPREKKHYTSRVESAGGGPLDVRCGCQYFQCDSLLPDRINPVGSRSESQQGYNVDIPQQLSEELLLQKPDRSRMQLDQVSTKSCIVPGRHIDADRISAKSFGGQKSFDQISNRSFGGSRNQNLDEIKRRGLVVRSISDATDPDGMAGTIVGPVLSRNQREISTDRMSNRSFGIRDPDTISTRSGIELRRISRPQSQQDLFVADINVPMQYGIHSRRSSKTEIPHFNIIAPTPTPTIGLKKPEFSVYEEFRQNKEALENDKENLGRSSYNNFKQNQPISIYRPTDSHSRERSPSSLNTLQQNQPIPMHQTTEKNNNELNSSHNTLPNIQKQNQPIPIYERTETNSSEISSSYNTSQNIMKQHQPIPVYQPTEPSSSDTYPSYKTSQPIAPGSQEFNTREINASPGTYQNILKQNQPIPIYEPPVGQVSPPPMFEISVPPLEKVYKETTVPINKIEIPVMSIELETIITEHHVLPEAPPIIVKEHPEKKLSCAVPSEISDNKLFPPSPTLQHLKRQHENAFNNSAIETQQKSLKLPQPEPENKSKTGSRQSSFRNFFGGKQKSGQNTPIEDYKVKDTIQDSPIRERTPMKFFGRKENIEHNNSTMELPRRREKSKSPSRERSPGRLLGKSKPELVMMSSGNNQLMSMSVSEPMKMTLSDSKTNQPTSTTVHETFSLKVEELDQYATKPKKILESPSSKSLQNLKVSNINLSESQKSTENSNIKDWAKVASPQQVLSNIQHPQPKAFILQSRKMASSQPDISGLAQNTSQEISNQLYNRPTLQQSTTNQNKALVSVNIGIDDPEFIDEEEFIESCNAAELDFASTEDHDKSLITQQIMDPTRPRAPSEQRIMQSALLRRKNYFDRTRSQDRTNSSQESGNDFLTGRMMKTVSFDFAGHESRIDEMDKLTRTSSKATDKNDWLEKTYFKRDHEYEPIGEPQETTSILKKELSPQIIVAQNSTSIDDQQQSGGIQQAEELQRDLEDRYFTSSNATTPRTESRTDYDIHTSQVDSSALEELPLKGENRKKSFMSSAQDRSRKFKAGIRTQAGKVKTKFRRSKKQSNTSGDSPKVEKERRKFKAPEFSKIKMPDMPKFKSPDMSKFKKPEFKKMEFKRPEFTKFNKPDMSKFKIPEKFASLKLKRSKSFKEEEVGPTSIETGESETTPESAATPAKKKFEFNFGTYPRALRRKKIKDSIEDVARANEVPSTVPSTETPPSVKLTTVLRGTRAEGPVGSRWQDKFSNDSFGDSESGRFQRYGSEVESFDRESSMERRMKEDLAAQEENELGAIGSVEHKQYADYDEENRAIHEISKIREGEFKQRRPMIHQDSNISEESKDVGWTDKDAMRNKILRQSDMENEGYNNKYASEDGLTGSMNTNHETQSTGSSGAKKGVIEEIDDDEFFLRKRGISQDNIEIRQYISSAIREGFDNPINSLAQLGNPQDEYPDSMLGSSQDQGDFGYDIPPPKPRRIKNYNNFNRNTESQEISQGYDEEQKENYDDNISLPQTGSDYFQNIPPNRPLRKSKKGYSQDSQSDIQNMPYFDDIEKEYYHKELNLQNGDEDLEDLKRTQPPQAPKRRKRQTRESVEKDSFINGFGGRSVSNTFLQNDNQPEDVIVYRTEHAYVIPLAQPESSISPLTSIQRSRSGTHNDEDDRTSHGTNSLGSSAMQAVQEETNEKFTIEIKGNDGYAVVRKEPPPRPPPPNRRKRHTQPSGNFATMPHASKETPPPERPKRCYSTIGPSRPPRRKTSFGSADLQKSASDITQYEEVEEDELIEQADLQKDLQSGDVIKKMKHRPLPPPPPPPRGKKKHHNEDNNSTYKDDHDGGAEKMTSDIQMNGNYDFDKIMEKCIEVEVSTQTDPLPDDFICEEFEITDDMKVIEPRNSKTLEDLLRDDQGEDLDFNKWTTEDNLSKGIQRFRDANQKSFSEKSKNSSAADRSRSHSRPQTPSAIIIEKRVPTPVPNNANETMLQASLTVKPIDDELQHEQHFAEDYHSSTSYQTSSEKERLNEFLGEERRLRQQEEDRRIMEEIRQREEEEEREIMEKIRELQRLEEEEEKITMEKLRELEIAEENMKQYKTEEEREEEEIQRREAEDRRVMEKIRELERQEEEDRQIMEKIRQLEREFADSSEKSPEVDSELKPEEHDYERRLTESPKTNLLSYPDPEVEMIEPEMSPPPNPPPRKRSSTNILPEDRSTVATVESSSLSPVIECSLPVAETTDTTEPALPTRMAVADLEVERLRVHALQAGNIMVSSLHGAQIGADELECKSGNLVVRNLELPAGFIEEIVQRVRTSERSHMPAETQTIESNDNKTSEKQSPSVQPEQAPERPPLPQQPIFPSEYMQSIPPASFFQLRDPTEEDYQPNMQAPRRRRHHRRRDSSSDDSHRHRSHNTRSPEPTVAQLGGQFLQACGTSLLRSMNQVANYVRTSQKVEGGERNIGTLIAIFILMTLGFLFMAMSGKNIHHHHWDYFNPPDNEGRQQQ